MWVRFTSALTAMTVAKSAVQPDVSSTLFKSAKAFETWL